MSPVCRKGRSFSTFLFCLFIVICVYFITNVFMKSNKLAVRRIKARDVTDRDHLRQYNDISSQMDNREGSMDGKQVQPSYEYGTKFHVMFLFTLAVNNRRLQENLRSCTSYLLKLSTGFLVIHIVGDTDSFDLARSILSKSSSLSNEFDVIHHEVSSVHTNILQIISGIHKNLSGGRSHYFSNPLFYLSIVLHKILSLSVSKIILLDIDVNITSDIAELFSLFDNFSSTNIIGIAKENQPVYRNVFWEFRKKNPGTRVGAPPPSGLTGYNSGVLLLHLDKMRKSVLYNSYLENNSLLTSLVRRYEFQGNLGDQDFFTLISLEHEELFYNLPCGWNRQLCQWWRRDDFIEVFDDYYLCRGPVHITHGNCQTMIRNNT